MNPFYNALGNQMPGNMQGVLQRFQQFRQSFTGDPRAQIQQMLNSGRITQAQYNQATQLAKQLQSMLR